MDATARPTITEHIDRWPMNLKTLKLTTILSLACAFTACGGGGSPSSSIAASAPTATASSIVTYGAITGFGSVFVNGTRFDVSSAQVTDNDSSATSDDLKVGQMVRLEAKDNHDGTLPRASRIDRDSAIEGAITAINTTAGTVTVLGQVILVDSSTIFDTRISPASLAGLAVGMVVEADGFVAADGTIHATRIEPHTAATDRQVTGSVAALDTVAKTFKIGTLTVSYLTATLVDVPTTGLANGDLVQVKGTTLNSTGQLVATTIKRKHFDDPTMRDANDVEFEGLVTRFVSATDFDVNKRAVTTTSTTRFEGGTVSALALNVAVEVEGKLNSAGVLVADKVSLHQEANVRIDGNVESIDATAGTLKVLGITIKVSTSTSFDDKSQSQDHFIALSKLAVGDHVQVRGIEDSVVANQLLATRLERESGSATTVELRGAVATLAQPNFKILTTSIATTPTTNFKGITATALFASTTHPLVKVRGTWDGNTLTAQSVEFETEETMHD